MNSQNTGYLCYDIRGIQGYIFQIPRLRYIVGGSALIDRFDRETVKKLAGEYNVKRISSGGGKGTFCCTSAEADELQNALIHEANAIGADIRFGFDADYSEAVHCAEKLFPYLPKNLDGHPCAASGLYPVQEGQESHPVIEKRNYQRGERMTRWFEKRLFAEKIDLPICLEGRNLEFFHNVDANDKENPRLGEIGCATLGKRNRWAVICMDGNDMGNQFRVASDDGRLTPEQMLAWVEELGKALDDCSTTACRAGIGAVLKQWTEDSKIKKEIEDGNYNVGESTVLPVRPLVVGGDDIVVLCHAAHAVPFVHQACDIFESQSRRLAIEAQGKGIDLWPATNGRITISAGILFCGTSLPLATAIPYAENLLAMAKRKGRDLNKDCKGEPSPACVDFESVTESMLDAPATRRHRELEFLDGDLSGECVKLTRRPYTAAELADLLEEAKKLNLPGSILHQLLPGLRAGFYDRQLFRYRLGKHQDKLFAALSEEERSVPDGSRWRLEDDGKEKRHRTTDLLDMVLLIQENRRMAKETAQ